MCDKCKPLDGRIAHYQGIALRMSDLQTLDGIKRLVLALEQKKLVLHAKE